MNNEQVKELAAQREPVFRRLYDLLGLLGEPVENDRTIATHLRVQAETISEVRRGRKHFSAKRLGLLLALIAKQRRGLELNEKEFYVLLHPQDLLLKDPVKAKQRLARDAFLARLARVIGSRAKSWRKRDEDLAKFLGLSAVHLSAVRYGQQQIGRRTLLKIWNFLQSPQGIHALWIAKLNRADFNFNVFVENADQLIQQQAETARREVILKNLAKLKGHKFKNLSELDRFFAEALGISPAEFSRVRTGTEVLSAHSFVRFREAFLDQDTLMLLSAAGVIQTEESFPRELFVSAVALEQEKFDQAELCRQRTACSSLIRNALGSKATAVDESDRILAEFWGLAPKTMQGYRLGCESPSQQTLVRLRAKLRACGKLTMGLASFGELPSAWTRDEVCIALGLRLGLDVNRINQLDAELGEVLGLKAISVRKIRSGRLALQAHSLALLQHMLEESALPEGYVVHQIPLELLCEKFESEK
ncbi:hypothetical protein JNK13_01555 [bacterium]|nr:hypothetical protein [bacterium]